MKYPLKPYQICSSDSKRELLNHNTSVPLKKLEDNLKIRYATMSYELEALLLNLNYKFDKVSGDIHLKILNYYSSKDKLKLSLNFLLAATQKKIARKRLFEKNNKILSGYKYINPNDF